MGPATEGWNQNLKHAGSGVKQAKSIKELSHFTEVSPGGGGVEERLLS